MPIKQMSTKEIELPIHSRGRWRDPLAVIYPASSQPLETLLLAQLPASRTAKPNILSTPCGSLRVISGADNGRGMRQNPEVGHLPCCFTSIFIFLITFTPRIISSVFVLFTFSLLVVHVCFSRLVLRFFLCFFPCLSLFFLSTCVRCHVGCMQLV